MEIGDRAVAVNQQTAPNHWAHTQQHHFKLIDGGFGDRHEAILTSYTNEAILPFNLPRFFSPSHHPDCLQEDSLNVRDLMGRFENLFL